MAAIADDTDAAISQSMDNTPLRTVDNDKATVTRTVSRARCAPDRAKVRRAQKPTGTFAPSNTLRRALS